MELQFYGANCLRISTKKAQIIIDDNLTDLNLKSVTKPGDIALFTGAHASPAAETKLVIDSPGEYEVAGVSIQGIAARSHMDSENQHSTVIYRIEAEDIRLVVAGHIYPDLSDDQLEAIGLIDVLCVPVGGHGYTLDGVGALKVIKEIEPKLVIPTHYADPKVGYTVPQGSLDEALKELAMEPKETVAKLKIKPAELTDTTQLVVLERQ